MNGSNKGVMNIKPTSRVLRFPIRIFVCALLIFAVSSNVLAQEYVRTYQVSAGPDDGYASGASSQNLTGQLIIGDGSISTPYYMSAARFTAVNIPRSASVTNAVIKIKTTGQDLNGQIYAQIRSESSDDAPDFTSRYIASAALNSAFVNWDHSGAWSANIWLTSPNISSVLQPVFNRAGWLRANDLTVLYRTRTNSNKTRSFASYDSSPADAPVLEITYQVYKISGHVRTSSGAPFAGAILTPSPDIEPAVSDASGYYELFVPPLWADNLTISKPGWGFNPNNLSFSQTTSDWNNTDFTALQCHITGYVKTSSGAGISGIQMIADNDGGSAVTNSSGYYDLLVPYSWTGTIRPANTDWSFNPGNRWLSNVVTNIAGIDFTASRPTISGRITDRNGNPKQSVQILTGDSNFSAVTNSSGNYSLTVPCHWSGTVTPNLSQWGFIPAGITYSDLTANQTNQNFTVFQPRIQGAITDNSGEPLYNFYVRFGTSSSSYSYTFTDVNGRYGFTVPLGWSGYVEPATSGWLYDPNQRIYSNLAADLNDQDFMARSVIISGYITEPNAAPVSGVMFNAPGCQTYFSDSNGYYWIRAPYNWSGTVSAYKAGWTFEPLNKIYTNLTVDSAGQNYTALSVIISGYVISDKGIPVQGVLCQATTTYYSYSDSNGFYWFRVPYNWSGTVTATHSHWVIIPPGRTYNDLTANQTGQNYAAHRPIIRGAVTMRDGSSPSGILLSAKDTHDQNFGTTTSDANGFYELDVSAHFTVTVTPSKTGLYFTPANRSYISISDDYNDQDYFASADPYPGGLGTPQNPYQIASANDLYAIGNRPQDFNKCFIQTADINFASYTGAQFKIIGPNSTKPFTGVFDGNGRSITNFKYSASGTTYVGLFGYASGAACSIKNVILAEPNVTGYSRVGALVGNLNAATVENCSAFNVAVTATYTYSYAGGLVGYQNSASGSIINCNTSGNVSGVSYLGGLVGVSSGVIDLCSSSCVVKPTTGGDRAGGLAGQSYSVSRSFSTGSVLQGGFYIGGLTGYNSSDITNCYSSADVNGNNYVAGLAGTGITITHCYSRGAVRGNSQVGGLVGYVNDPATVKFSYWDVNTSGLSTGAAGLAKTTALMKSRLTYLGWPSLWNLQQDIDYPHLIWEGLPGDVLPSDWYAAGSGTFNDPYIISTAEHLAAIGYIPGDWNKYFRLEANIDCSQFEGQFLPIGNGSQSFTGGFDGAGHTISKLIIDTNTEGFAGLFGFIDGAQVSCLGLIDPEVRGDHRVGALAGEFCGGLLEQCWVRAGAVTGNQNIGGLVGYSSCSDSVIQNCYARTAVSGDLIVGGLIGYNSGRLIDSYSTGLVTANQEVGGLIGFTNPEPVINCFWDIETSGQSASAAGIGKTTAQMMQFQTFFNWSCQAGWTILDGADYPRVACENAPGVPIEAALSDYLPGDGSPANPYQISDAAGLNMVGQFNCAWNRHFILTADIDMASIPADAYHIIGNSGIPFTGVFNGNNHSIINFSCVTNSNYVGLFGCVSDVNSRITNLKLVNPYIDAGAGANVGSLAGYVLQATISDCSVQNGYVNSTGNTVGGLVGYFSGDTNLTRCSVLADVTGQAIVGGLAGFLSANAVSDCSAQGNISALLHEAGGFAGHAAFNSLSDCFSSGSVTAGTHSAGGFIGFILPSPSPSGFDIVNCNSNSVVTAIDFVGGFVGQTQSGKKGRFSSCSSVAEVIASGINAGGFAGFNDANLTACSVTASVSGLDRIGGLCGYSNNIILTSRFTGSVNGTSNLGGIVGYQDTPPYYSPAIMDSYAEGQVSGVSNIGGLVGYSRALISNSYSACAVSGSTNVGGLVGYPASYTPSNCVWDSQISDINKPCGYGYGYCESSNNRARTTQQMKSALSFASWACDANWTIDDGLDCPRLAWENQPGAHIYDLIFDLGAGDANNPIQIYNPQQLIAMGWASCVWNKNFVLTTDLRLADVNQADFRPIGSSSRDQSTKGMSFTGTFDGGGHFISDLNCVGSVSPQGGWIQEYGYYGLFGALDVNAQVKNIGLLRPNIAASGPSGTLVGRINRGTVSNCFSIGGAVRNTAGGTGGLVGDLMTADARILDSYAITDVNGPYAGGLAGYNTGQIQRCYAAGRVLGASNYPLGGLIAYLYSSGSVSASFWDTNTSGLLTSPGGTGLTTEQMKTYDSFANAGWDLDNNWHICEPTNYPKLIWQLSVTDFLCPDGVDFLDFSFLASRWLWTEYGDCNGFDITADGAVNLVDFDVLAKFWQRGACGDCLGADYSGDARVDIADLIILSDNWLIADYGDIEGAELTGDGIIDPEDLLDFSNNWLSGF